MKLLLIHLSDLFYGSGTAVIYRRLLALLEEKAEIHHYVGSWRSGSQQNVLEKYRAETAITPHFTPFIEMRGYYARLSRRWNRNTPDLRLPAMMDAHFIKQTIRKVNPDIIWWSGDYLPVSMVALANIPDRYFENRRLLFSLYDPPGFWSTGKWKFLHLFHRNLKRVHGMDVIGENMVELVKEQGFERKPVILNDYVETELSEMPALSGSFRVVMTGQIYGGWQLQEFLTALSNMDDVNQVEIHWFGNNQNLQVSGEIDWPSNVRLIKKGTVPRNELPSMIQDFDAGYFNMSTEATGFAKYSIPTKLITYLEAGLPILFHAPRDTEVNQLNNQYGFGLNLEIENHPVRVKQNRQKMQTCGKNLISDRYRKETLRKKLLEYLHIN